MTLTKPGKMQRGLAGLSLMLVSACSTPTPAPPAAVNAPLLPPMEAPPALPSMCEPTCSAGLQRLLLSWQQLLMPNTPTLLPAQPATAERPK